MLRGLGDHHRRALEVLDTLRDERPGGWVPVRVHTTDASVSSAHVGALVRRGLIELTRAAGRRFARLTPAGADALAALRERDT